MTQIQFYQLLTTPLERALPKLLEKASGGGYRVQLVVESEERLDFLNQWLWTYDQDSFLPHGSSKDAHPERQPIHLGTTVDAPNSPDLLLVTEGSKPPEAERYRRIVDMFDGRNEEALASARARWSEYKSAGHEISYFQQNESGGWEKKA